MKMLELFKDGHSTETSFHFNSRIKSNKNTGDHQSFFTAKVFFHMVHSTVKYKVALLLRSNTRIMAIKEMIRYRVDILPHMTSIAAK